MTIDSAYPRTGRVGQALRIPLRLTQGRATRLEVWLAGEPKATVVAPQGVEFMALNVFVMPQRSGAMRLFAAAEDECGNRNATTAIRTVTVTP